MIESRWIPGFEDHYFVTSEGRVFSAKFKKVKELKLTYNLSREEDRKGYLKVGLHIGFGLQIHRLVHHLVLEAFVGPKPSEDHMGLHRDDNKTNNHLDNLYWGTRPQNVDDAKRNGRLKGRPKSIKVRPVEEFLR